MYYLFFFTYDARLSLYVDGFATDWIGLSKISSLLIEE